MTKLNCKKIIKPLNGGAVWVVASCPESIRLPHGPRIAKTEKCDTCSYNKARRTHKHE